MSKILVDSCVWSEVLRRKNPSPTIHENLAKMLIDLQAVIIGAIRQEVLSGISNETKFTDLRERLSPWPDAPVVTADHKLAAEYSNMCRRKGIQGSAVDFLICAVAVRNDFAIYTVDKDFDHYKTVLPIKLWR